MIAQSPAAPALLCPDDFIATNVSMQTDLKMQNEINSEDGLNLFWDGGL